MVRSTLLGQGATRPLLPRSPGRAVTSRRRKPQRRQGVRATIRKANGSSRKKRFIPRQREGIPTERTAVRVDSRAVNHGPLTNTFNQNQRKRLKKRISKRKAPGKRRVRAKVRSFRI